MRGNGSFHGGGAGYRLQEFTWECEKIWEWMYASDQHLMHHDIEPMPNGNILILAWEVKTKDEAITAGRDPELLKEDELWPEHILEIKPVYPDGAEIVWEWHLWDHLIQDFDASQDNYGVVDEHPELVEINPTGHWLDRISIEEQEELEALGYLGGGDDDDDDDGDDSTPKKPRGGTGADWLHGNAIDYNPRLDQIAISSLGNNEIWVLDHSTTTDEARGHTAGRAGMGGDVLYRWGNPLAYHRGDESDQASFHQHDIQWVPYDRPGGGNLLVYNNGGGRSDGNYSSVVELDPKQRDNGSYKIKDTKPFGPRKPYWEYTAPVKTDFYSNFISGAERQPNGNTLICEGATGTFFEVTRDKKMVWRYVNPAVPPQRPAEPEVEGEEKKEKPRPFTNIVFRVYRYAPDYPAFKGKDLSPGPLLTDYLQVHPAIVPKDLTDADKH
jgi:hypothetical protein